MASSVLVLNPAEVEFYPFPRRTCSGGFHPRDGWPRSGAIVIFLATLGSKTVSSMEIFSSDTIASVKLRIQAFKGFFTNQQRLVHCGRELRGDNRNLMKDCGICSGEVVHLVLRLSDLVNVKVKTVLGAEYTFKVRKNERVMYLKQRISEKEGGLKLDEQQLVFQGRRLDDHRRILDLHTEEDVVIHLLVKKSAAKVRSRSLGSDVELSITSSELDSLIGSFSNVGVQESFITSINDDISELPPVDAPPKSAQPIGLPFREEPIRHEVLSHDFVLEPFRDFGEILRNHPDSLLRVLQQARSGLQAGHSPVLASEGSGGTYFMKDTEGRSVAVFKPVDEEPEAVNNPRSSPRSSSNEGLKSGIIVGEGALREVAAYLLDHPETGYRSSVTRNQEGFAGVPPTMMVLSSHRVYNYSSGSRKTKVGSLQKYVDSMSNCEDMGPASFPVGEVHKISVLDLRLANTDRNGGNILVCKNGGISNLVPIDHGYCLPDKWFQFRQLRYWKVCSQFFRDSHFKPNAPSNFKLAIHGITSSPLVLSPFLMSVIICACLCMLTPVFVLCWYQ
ncbi:unnamed protein product [Calypogeia fissa]